jgi:hypothetical protein
MKLLAGFLFGLAFRHLGRFDQRKGRIRELLPDGEVFRRNGKPAECEHVAARLGYLSDLPPSEFIDDQSIRPCEGCNVVARAKVFWLCPAPEQFFIHSQFESIEL